ncbi:LOW QUALITY PROTEIN: cilia- and flagella-associated protein 65 [Pelodytes ibericus]
MTSEKGKLFGREIEELKDVKHLNCAPPCDSYDSFNLQSDYNAIWVEIRPDAFRGYATVSSEDLNGYKRTGSLSIRNVTSGINIQSQKVKKVRGKREAIMGFEVCKCLHWQNWDLGIEATKTLTLKNVKLKTQKVIFSPPSTPFFRTLFPQSVTLMQGTSFSLPVTFRPLEKRDYEDCIEFEAEEGSFFVALRATLPRPKLLFPEEVALPTCAAHDTSKGSFVLRNASDLQTSFRWEDSSCFLLTPASGVLDPGCEIRMQVLFQPQMALVHNVNAVCRFGINEEYEKSLQLTAIAKYPHLEVRVPGAAGEEKECLLQFGSVGVGSIIEKHVEVHNVSVVDSPFRIERAKRPSQLDCHFYCDIEHGVVPAHGKLRIPIQFRPRIAGMENVDYFHVIPVGNLTKSVLKVSGSCQGPRVSLRKSLLNFGVVNLGEQILRILEVTNSSDVPAHYQLIIDSKESVFSFDQPCGIIGPWETKTLQVIFSPLHPIPHYRRVACLIHHQNPLFVDLIGTCHTDLEKPAILLPKHLSLYRKNMMRGLTAYPPDILGAMLQEGKLGTDTEGALVLLTQELNDQPPEEYSSTDSVTEFFVDEFSKENPMIPHHITATTRDFDFGCCIGKCQNSFLPFSLTNHTKGKVTVVWTSKSDCPFQVTPEITEIPPLKSTAFIVTFHPSQSNTLYAGELEGFIFYKVLRDYRNVEDGTMCLPWCITLSARGHTFELGHEHFVPGCVLDCPHMVFPPVKLNGQTQRTLLLQNTSPSPLVYVTDQESCPSIQAKPTSGQVSSSSHQILLLKNTPNEAGLTRHSLPLQLNFSPNYTQEIVLYSCAETPQLLLEGDGKLFCRPTCIGAQSEYSYSFQNCSRIPLHFEWKIQQADTSFISVNPASGIIRPNENMAQTWSFVPQEEKKYFAKATVLVWPTEADFDPVNKTRYILRITGQGCKGSLSTEKEQVDLGNILVGSFQSWDLLLSNDGDCTLDYILSAKQEISGPCDQDEVINDPVVLEFEKSTGKLPARTKLNIRVTARPARRLQYTWRINYQVNAPKALNPADVVSEEQFLCCVMAHGVFPTFSIVDTCPAGSAVSLNKTQLWRLFSLERLNAYLERDPTAGELIYRVPTRHSTRSCPLTNTPLLLDFNFGAAPVGTEPFVALLLLENKGVLPVNWDFLFPADQQIELEFWAEAWEFDPSEIHQMRIQDNKLFTVSPKSGLLNPGQQCVVELTYRHDFVGTDRLPVLLKVSHGREILLNFIGVTVEMEKRYVHFTSTKHQFTPVAIGSSSPSKQIYELYNGGSVAVIYEIQLEPLRKIQEQNYQHPIFQCLNPRGEILPGATAFVEWIFFPLESKTYSVYVPVHILGGDSALITFEGIGYDSSTLGDSAVFEGFAQLPATPRLIAAGQMVHLSKQRLSFGDIPVFCKSSRLLFLNNTSWNESAFFSWYAGSPNVREILQVSPLSGVLRPGESTNVTVTLQAGEQAAFYTLDLICEIFTEKALTKYDQELLEWQEEEKRQSVEFTITERDKNEPPTVVNVCIHSGPPQILKGGRERREIQRYKTLPPIKNAEVSRPPASRDRESRRAEKVARQFWARPEPPVPWQLHLSVTGRSHHIADFVNHFHSDFQRHFHCRLPKNREEKPEPVDLQPETGEPDTTKGKPTHEEQEITVDIMTSVIQNLLNDKHFHEALLHIQNDDVPYFSQLTTQENIPSTADGSLGIDLNPPVAKPHLAASAEEEDGEMSPQVGPGEMTCGPTESPKPLKADYEVNERIKRSWTFSLLVESVLENTLQNIMIEANRGEVVLTARPRVIALPPVTSRGINPISTARTISMGHKRPMLNSNEEKDFSDGAGRVSLPESQKAPLHPSHAFFVYGVEYPSGCNGNRVPNGSEEVRSFTGPFCRDTKHCRNLHTGGAH